jgi:signal peptide peptidase SppA
MSLDRFPHLAQRLFNVPLAITPGKLEVIVAAVADRMGVSKLLRPSGEAIMLADLDLSGESAAPERAYEVVEGVAIIPVSGTLVQKLGTLRPYSGMTGYDGIRANLSMALHDDTVRAIALDCESPGGEVAGCFDLVDDIFAVRGEKPMWAILTEHAYSACYAIASACDRIIVPRTGGTGSVGVVCAHVDFSRALDAAGVTIDLIAYGDRKADGSEYRPLSKEARARFQADVDEMGDLFVQTVARNRNLSSAKVRSTQAGTFMGATGVEVGFADAVLSPREAFRSLLDELG